MPLNYQLRNQHLLWRAGFGPAVEQLNDLATVTPKQLFKALQKASSKNPTVIDVADDFLKGLYMGAEEAARQQRREMSEDERKQIQRKNREGVRNLNLFWLDEMVNS